MRTAYGMFTFLLALFVSESAFAGNTGKIAGRVTDINGGPLPGASLVIEGTARGAVADAEGYYVILNVEPGEYTLSASLIGYQKVTKRRVVVHGDFTTTLNFQLKEIPLEQEEVVVVGERPPVEPDKTTSKYVVTAADIQRIPQVRTIEEIMQLQPGVYVDGSGKIRGSDTDFSDNGPNGSFNNVAYYVDGIRIVNTDGRGATPVFTGPSRAALRELTVITGGMEAEYGNAEGGIVSTTTKESVGKMDAWLEYKFTPPGKRYWGSNIYDSAIFGKNLRWDDPIWANEKDPVTGLLTHPRTNYDSDAGHFIEGSLSGPLTKKAGFFVSLTFDRQSNTDLTSMPQNHLPFNRRITANLTFRPTMNIKVKVGGLLALTSNWNGTTRGLGDNGKNVFLPKDWASSGKQSTREDLEYVTFIHSLSPKSFYEIKVSRHRTLKDTSDVPAEAKVGVLRKDKAGYFTLPTSTLNYQLSDRERYAFKFDLTGQVTRGHMIKTGFELTQYKMWETLYAFSAPSNRTLFFVGKDHQMGKGVKPLQGAFYLQDKMEFEGLVINAGIRFDFLDPKQKFVRPEISVSPMYRSPTRFRQVPMEDASWLTTWSPRLGISHPISSKTSVRFFMGRFYQFPDLGWVYVEGWSGSQPDSDLNKNNRIDPAEKYNTLTPQRFGFADVHPERTISFEVGVDWNFIADYTLSLTTFYKDAGGQIRNVGSGDGWLDPVRQERDIKVMRNTGYETAKGIELSFKKAFGSYTSFNLSYNAQWMDASWSGPRSWVWYVMPDSNYVASGKYWREFTVDLATGAEIPKPLTAAQIAEIGHRANEQIRNDFKQAGAPISSGFGETPVRVTQDGLWAHTRSIYIPNERWTKGVDLRHYGSLTFLLGTPPNFKWKFASDLNAVLIHKMRTGTIYLYVPPKGPQEMRHRAITTVTDLNVLKGFQIGRRRVELYVEVFNLFDQKDDRQDQGRGFVPFNYVQWGLLMNTPDAPQGDRYELIRHWNSPRKINLGLRLTL